MPRWDQIQADRRGKEPIGTWEKMKSRLRGKFVPPPRRYSRNSKTYALKDRGQGKYSCFLCFLALAGLVLPIAIPIASLVRLICFAATFYMKDCIDSGSQIKG